MVLVFLPRFFEEKNKMISFSDVLLGVNCVYIISHGFGTLIPFPFIPHNLNEQKSKTRIP